MTKVRKCPVCAPWNVHHAQTVYSETRFVQMAMQKQDWPYMAALQDLPQHNATMDDGVSKHRLLM